MPKRCSDSCDELTQGEDLALGLYSPEIFETETGKLTVEALKTTYFWPNSGHVDACGESTGVSVARIDFDIALEELYNQLTNISGRANRNIEGHACIKVIEIARLSHDALCVLDDGKPSFTTHAVIRARQKEPKGKLRLMRDSILEQLNARLVRTTRSNL